MRGLIKENVSLKMGERPTSLPKIKKLATKREANNLVEKVNKRLDDIDKIKRTISKTSATDISTINGLKEGVAKEKNLLAKEKQELKSFLTELAEKNKH